MREHYQRLRQKAHSAVRATPRWLAVVVVVLSLVTAGVAAQELVGDRSADFEDGTAEGWDGPAMSVVEESTEGQYSLRQSDGYEGDARPVTWESGPVLTLEEEFTVRATTYAAPGDGSYQTRAGLINENDQGAMLVFSYSADATLLTDDGTDYDVGTAPSMDTAYENTWVSWELYSPGNGTLRAKIWEAGSTEPTEYQMSREFDANVSSGYGIVAGNVEDGNRYIQVDNVQITGTLATDPDLSLNTRQLYQPGSTHEYTVRETRYENGQNRSYVVTDNATVESLNTSLLTVNEENNTLTATDDPNASATVVVRAQYNGSTAYQEVTVAEPTVENLQIVPGIWRFFAVFDDATMFTLLIAALLSVPAARFTSAFGGLAVSEMVIVIGWVTGYVAFGYASVSVFVALFIGLNLAANIDYQVRK